MRNAPSLPHGRQSLTTVYRTQGGAKNDAMSQAASGAAASHRTVPLAPATYEPLSEERRPRSVAPTRRRQRKRRASIRLCATGSRCPLPSACEEEEAGGAANVRNLTAAIPPAFRFPATPTKALGTAAAEVACGGARRSWPVAIAARLLLDHSQDLVANRAPVAFQERYYGLRIPRVLSTHPGPRREDKGRGPRWGHKPALPCSEDSTDMRKQNAGRTCFG